jgi:alanine dehydrogenase
VDLSTLLLTKSDVEKLVIIRDAIDAVRSVFREHALGKTKTYPRVHIPFEEFHGTIGYLEAAVDSLGSSASKIASLYFDNPTIGLPRIVALISLNRIDNGLPVAIMDGNYLTMLRTAAVSAVATDYLAKKDAKKLGIIGAGVQGRGQLLGMREVRNITEVLVFDISIEASERFARDMASSLEVDIQIANSLRELKDCDIISCATPSKEPLVTAELLHPGLHINSVGMGAGLGKKEIDFGILRKMKVVVDDKEVAQMDALSEAFRDGFITTSEIYASLGDLILGRVLGRTGNETTIFVSAGMAIQDVAVAKLAYDRAVEKKVGRKLDFFT